MRGIPELIDLVPDREADFVRIQVEEDQRQEDQRDKRRMVLVGRGVAVAVALVGLATGDLLVAALSVLGLIPDGTDRSVVEMIPVEYQPHPGEVFKNRE